MLIPVQNNAQIDAAEKEKALAIPNINTTRVVTELAAYVRSCWMRAYTYKQPVHRKLIENLRNFNSEYEPGKLFEIRKLKGSEQFLSLISTKCIAAIAWLNDIFDQPNKLPWNIEPTPMPELPIEMETRIRHMVLQEVVGIVNQYAAMSGQNPNEMIEQFLPQIRKRVHRKLYEKAEEGVDELKLLMSDQLVEGGWYAAFKECLFDMVVYKSAILKGAIFRRVRRFSRGIDTTSGGYVNRIQSVIVPTFERRSPFSIYPAPDSTGVNDSYLCDLFPLNLKQLYDLIGVEGFNEEAIRRVLNQYRSGGLREWAVTDTEVQRLIQGGMYLDTDKVDVVEYWGDIHGQFLLDWGLTPDDIPDKDRRYDVCVWLIGNEVIKAMLNPNPLGLKPYSVSSYVPMPGAFWGRGLPELIEDLQQICNALVRAIVNNAGMSSAPMVEYDTDRVAGFDQTLYPMKAIESTSRQMETAAVRFYQPRLTAMQLMQVLQQFIRIADQYSLPSYAHGDTQVGGAGKTASGLSMLMGSANRVVKNVVKNADVIVRNSIKLLYYFNAYYNADKLSFVGDVNVVAQGITSMLKSEQMAVRKQEFLAVTNNPTDLQIVGIEGRKALLKDVAESIDIDALAKVFPQIDEIDGLKAELEQLMTEQREEAIRLVTSAQDKVKGAIGEKGKGTVPAPKPRAIDLAGNIQSGQDVRLLPQGSIEPGRS